MSETGTLFYLMGPSGAGKDSLLAYARRELAGNQRVKFVQRCITRPPAACGDEEYLSLAAVDFELCLSRGVFAMHWSAHGLKYGIRKEVNDWLEQKNIVVVNGSRSYFPQAQALYPDLHAVIVRVKPEILRRRLIARKRENLENIEERLLRAKNYDLDSEPSSRISTIDNSGTLDCAGRKLTTLIKNCL